MSKIKNYEDFIKDNQSKTGKVDESNYMAKYSSLEFKNMFSDKILEKDEFIKEDRINKMHATYELEMLYESKSHWVETPGSIHFLDFGDHIFLVKNSEGFLLEKKTFRFVKNGELQNSPILEEWNWRDFVPDFIEKGIDKLSGGAQKVMSWLKKAKNAIGEFIHKNHKAISLILSILTAVFGIVGIFVPGFSIAGGVCMLLNGILHLSHGWGDFNKGRDLLINMDLPNNDENNPEKISREHASIASGIMSGIPSLLSGGLMMCLGANDIWHGTTTAMTPAGAAAAVHSESTKKGAMKLLEKTVTSVGETVEHTVGHTIELFTKHVVPNSVKFAGETLLPEATKALAAGSIGIASIYLHKALTGLIGWIYTKLLKSASAVVSSFEYISKIPAKVSKMIKDFSDGAEGFVQKLISSGLNSLIKPMTDCIAGFIEKYVAPGVESVKKFISIQLFGSKVLKWIKSNVHDIGLSAIPDYINDLEKMEIQSAPKSDEKIIPNTEVVKISDDDKSKMEEIAEKEAEKNGEGEEKEVGEREKIKDSYNTKNYRYLKDFKKFGFY